MTKTKQKTKQKTTPLGKPYFYYADIDYESRYDQGAYDGDTIDFLVDVGFKMYTRQRIRLLRVNTPEIKGKTKEKGIAFRDLTRGWLREAVLNYESDDWPFIIETRKSDAFGRYLANIVRRDTGEDLSTYLLSQGSPKYVK